MNCLQTIYLLNLWRTSHAVQTVEMTLNFH